LGTRTLFGGKMTVLAAGLILSALASAPITVAFQHARGVQPGAQKRPTVPLCARVRPLRVHMPDSVRQDNVLGPVIDDREWKAWTSRFSGKFVTKSGTATLTSRRAAAEEGGEAGGEIAVLQLDAGRSLSNEDLDAIAAAAGDVQSDFIANLRGVLVFLGRVTDPCSSSRAVRLCRMDG
jgi:hypothetical protein